MQRSSQPRKHESECAHKTATQADYRLELPVVAPYISASRVHMLHVNTTYDSRRAIVHCHRHSKAAYETKIARICLGLKRMANFTNRTAA